MLDREKDGIYVTESSGKLIGALTRKQTIAAVECPVCSAPRGVACNGPDLSDEKSHPERRKEAMKQYGILSPQTVLANNRIDKWYQGFRSFLRDPDRNPPPAPKKTTRKPSRPSARASKGMVTRYECPLCGGDHLRSDHPSLQAIIARRRKERAS